MSTTVCSAILLLNVTMLVVNATVSTIQSLMIYKEVTRSENK